MKVRWRKIVLAALILLLIPAIYFNCFYTQPLQISLKTTGALGPIAPNGKIDYPRALDIPQNETGYSPLQDGGIDWANRIKSWETEESGKYALYKTCTRQNDTSVFKLLQPQYFFDFKPGAEIIDGLSVDSNNRPLFQDEELSQYALNELNPQIQQALAQLEPELKFLESALKKKWFTGERSFLLNTHVFLKKQTSRAILNNNLNNAVEYCILCALLERKLLLNCDYSLVCDKDYHWNYQPEGFTASAAFVKILLRDLSLTAEHKEKLRIAFSQLPPIPSFDRVVNNQFIENYRYLFEQYETQKPRSRLLLPAISGGAFNELYLPLPLDLNYFGLHLYSFHEKFREIYRESDPKKQLILCNELDEYISSNQNCSGNRGARWIFFNLNQLKTKSRTDCLFWELHPISYHYNHLPVLYLDAPYDQWRYESIKASYRQAEEALK